MTTPERREVGEILTRLEHEHDDFDIYVEGPSDAALINWYLREHGRRRHKIFQIDDVALPDHIIPRGVPTSGNRDRVVGLADLISDHFPDGHASAVCLADRDLDVVLGDLDPVRFLLQTDGTSLETLFFDVDVMERFLCLFIRRRVAEPVQLLHAMEPVLEDIFLVRAADRSLGLHAGALSFAKSCTVGAPDLVEIDLDHYLRSYLSRIGEGFRLDEFRDEMERLRGVAGKRGVRLIHGHDFVDLLCWTLRPYVNDQRLVQPLIAHRALMTSLRLDEVDRLPMFGKLLELVPV